MKSKKRKNKSAIIIAVLSILVIAFFLFLFTNPSFWFEKSIHTDAKRYATKSCLAFYPDGEDGKNTAKSLCRGVKDNRVYDYSLVPYGDYYMVNYGNDISYFVDKEYNDIEIKELSDFGKRIISDYLRLTVKKQDSSKYYDSSFMEQSYVDNINFENITFNIKNENIVCRLIDFDYDIEIPLKYMQNEIGMNFGYDNENYHKPTFIDNSKEHPVICLTFDDGPQLRDSLETSSSVSIVDTLNKYDAVGTFYVVGSSLEERLEWTDYQVYSFLSQSIINGNEYGSHTSNHDDLIDFSTAEGIKNAINEPVVFLKDLLNYDVTTYRPPGGEYNDNVLSAQDYPAILWNTDSGDWEARNAEEIYKKVMSYDYYDGDVILFHDIYDETAEAIKKIVPELLNKGCQLVTVKDMLEYAGINVNSLKYYYNLNPKPYFE